VSYRGQQRSDFTKLGTLGSEGRSTATTILSLSAVRHLRRDEALRPEARKLLSFTDNRQDAALQAGHFNDFVQVGLLRSALYRAAAKAGREGLSHDALTQQVFEALALPLDLYAKDHSVRFAALTDTQKALRDFLGHRLYLDLRRGWRITSPNLEQTGLLRIDYLSLDELAAAEDVWRDAHPALAAAAPAARERICHTLLDFLRRSLAIKVNYLEREFQERLTQLSSQGSRPRGRSTRTNAFSSQASPFPGPASETTGARSSTCRLAGASASSWAVQPPSPSSRSTCPWKNGASSSSRSSRACASPASFSA
jgi:hypothetical protein